MEKGHELEETCDCAGPRLNKDARSIGEIAAEVVEGARASGRRALPARAVRPDSGLILLYEKPFRL